MAQLKPRCLLHCIEACCNKGRRSYGQAMATAAGLALGGSGSALPAALWHNSV